jgi:U3 small nucleolar ribonucleoprotein protein IMP4
MKFLVTTSKRPSKRVRSFVKDLAQIFSYERIVRGKKSSQELRNILMEKGGEGILIVDTKKGNPSRIRVIKNNGSTYQILLKGARLLREFPDKIPILSKDPLILANNEMALEIAKILNLKTVDSLDKLKENTNIIVVNVKKIEGKGELYLVNLYNVKTKKYYGPLMKIRKIL